MIHAADETTSNIVSKSISVGKGRATYRGLVHIPQHLKGCKNNTECDALLINSTSRTDTYPAITVRGTGNATRHEASVWVCGRLAVSFMGRLLLSPNYSQLSAMTKVLLQVDCHTISNPLLLHWGLSLPGNAEKRGFTRLGTEQQSGTPLMNAIP
jgi:hypothetical protein